MAQANNLFIEKRDGGYVILRGGVHTPVDTAPTQEKAIEKARKLHPDAAIHVERVREVDTGGPDKWRKI